MNMIVSPAWDINNYRLTRPNMIRKSKYPPETNPTYAAVLFFHIPEPQFGPGNVGNPGVIFSSAHISHERSVTPHTFAYTARRKRI